MLDFFLKKGKSQFFPNEFETINYLKKKTINIRIFGDDILYLKNYNPSHLMDQIDSKWTKWTK